MGRQEDEMLARAIADGDSAAEISFDRRFRTRIEAIVQKRGVPGNDGPDVAQRVLTEALRQLRLGLFRGDATLGTWLYPIIGGTVSNYFRRPTGPRLVRLDDLGSADWRSLVTSENSEIVLAVRQALSRLSAEDRLLLVLYYREGRTLEEVGPVLDLDWHLEDHRYQSHAGCADTRTVRQSVLGRGLRKHGHLVCDRHCRHRVVLEQLE